MIAVRAAALLAIAAAAGACQSGRSPGGREREQAARAAEQARHAPVAARPIFVRGPTGGPIAPFVAREIVEGQKGGFNVLVYVGATWCEPCQRFHAAAQAGEFDAILPGAHVIEFDLDQDKQALADAGYSSKLIPLFCVPKTDGTASDRRIEGSIKGAEAVNQNLIPRLRSFLEGAGSG